MKKIILPVVFGFISIFGLSVYANDNSFMSKALNSWIDSPLDNFIKAWGYPDEEKDIAGKKLFYWYIRNAMKTNYYNNVGSSYTQPSFCTVIIEVDPQKNIVDFQYKGNDCPVSYMTNKNLVNSENDPWEKEKQRKLENKRKRTAEKQMKNNKK